MTAPRPHPVEMPMEALARLKLTRVLGASRAEQLFGQVLADAGLTALTTADDLMLFGRALARRDGFEGTVGTMLVVDAVLRGAAA